jgi:hypothetical protein
MFLDEKRGEIMNEKTEILSVPEIKQSNIETRVYDEAAQFYAYCEGPENKTIVENGARPRKSLLLRGSFAVLGGICLLAGLAAGIYFSKQLFHSAPIDQFSAENLPKDKSADVSFGESKSAENGFEPEKTVKPKQPEDKNNSGGKTDFEPNETKTVKITEKSDTNSLPNRDAKVEIPVKPTNSNVSKQIVPNDSNRDFWTIPATDKNPQRQPPLQRQPPSRQTEREWQAPESSGRFREWPQTRREPFVKKMKQSNLTERIIIKERRRRQRMKN